MRYLILAFLIALAPLSAHAGEADHDAELLHVLGLIDIALDAELLTHAGVTDAGGLVSAALDRELTRYVRSRAVHALAFYPSAETAATASAIAHDTAEDREVRIAAIFVATRFLLEADGARSLIEALRSDPDDQIQAALDRATARLAGSAAAPE